MTRDPPGGSGRGVSGLPKQPGPMKTSKTNVQDWRTDTRIWNRLQGFPAELREFSLDHVDGQTDNRVIDGLAVADINIWAAAVIPAPAGPI